MPPATSANEEARRFGDGGPGGTGRTSRDFQASLGFLLGGLAVLVVAALLRGRNLLGPTTLLFYALLFPGAILAAVGAIFAVVNGMLLRQRHPPRSRGRVP